MNISLPLPQEDLDEGDRGGAWPHVDQSPNRRFKHCIQGIMNLAENGPDDGGLMVLEGSLPLYNEYFETHEEEFMPVEGWTWRDSYHFAAKDQLQWFYDRGCSWKKVEAGPGDVILWDSRCIHYGAAARGDRPRVATCEFLVHIPTASTYAYRRLLQACRRH
jgi:ectoine hydroxylase-related dioxygenase (phytanoyl-CoA dioxygenase family)